jgi:hypothetical protein
MGQNWLWLRWDYNGTCFTDLCYEEVLQHYDYDRLGYYYTTAHFTQLVWKRSTWIGIGRATYGREIYVVADYTFPGNVYD